MSHTMFSPAHVAIIGASPTPHSVGHDILTNVKNSFDGQIFAVNPKYTDIDGTPCYAKITDIKTSPELVIIAIPAKFVEVAVQDCAAHGVKYIVLITAGFSEVGNTDMEQNIVDICRSAGIILLGPNCLGFIRAGSLNASFGGAELTGGNIAFISQSGAMGTALMDAAVQYGLGIHTFVSVGNKAMLGEIELLNWFENDEYTQVIALYLESSAPADQWLQAMQSVTKPVIVFKSGRTDFGASASSSHTAALATNDTLFSALCTQANLIRANTIQQLFDYCQAFSVQPSMTGKSVAIITNAGGPGVIAADAVSEHGLELAPLSEQMRTKIQAAMPGFATVSNPVDVLGDADEYRFLAALDAALVCEDVDAIQVIVTPQKSTPISAIVDGIIARMPYHKPVTVSLFGGTSMTTAIQALNQNQVDVTDFPEYGIDNLAALHTWSHHNTHVSEKHSPIATASATLSAGVMLEPDVLQLLSEYGISVPPWHFAPANNLDTLQTVQPDSTWAVKIVSPDILHKTDVGGVQLRVPSDQVAAVAEQIVTRVQSSLPQAKITGIVCTQMQSQSKAVECIVGLKHDPVLGHAVMIGAGGTTVELWNDVAFVFPPFTKNQAEKALQSLTSFRLLNGFRGSTPKDVTGIIDTMMKLQQLHADHPEITELDMNPLLVFGTSTVVVDGKIVVGNKGDM